MPSPSFLLSLQGTRSFFPSHSPATPLPDFSRLVSIPSSSPQILLRLDPSHALSTREEERDLSAFDCYSLYRHSDLTFEWRLCKIMQKEPLLVDNTPLLGQWYYWIEFLHHRKLGQKIWLKRRREDILMSARYAKEQVRNYEQETLRFIRDTYLDREEKPKARNLTSIKKDLYQQNYFQ